MVTSFWKERHGGLLIFLDPAADTPNLTSLLREHGVAPNDDRVLSVQSIPGVASRKIRNVPVGVISNIDGTGRGPDLPSMSILLNERVAIAHGSESGSGGSGEKHLAFSADGRIARFLGRD